MGTFFNNINSPPHSINAPILEDYKTISLELFNKQVLILLKASSGSFTTHGAEVIGILVARKWGPSNNWQTVTSNEETVTCLSIKTESGLIVDIPTGHIKYLAKTF